MLQRMLESFNLCNFPFAKAMHNINVTIIRWAAHAGRGRHPVRQCPTDVLEVHVLQVIGRVRKDPVAQAADDNCADLVADVAEALRHHALRATPQVPLDASLCSWCHKRK